MTRTLSPIESLLTNISVVRRTVVVLFGVLLSLPSPANAQTSLALVSARDHLEGGMTSPQSVYADETRIYLATVQGTLFVLSRDRAANFPVIQTIPYTSALHAVRGDAQNVYVAAGDGNLLVYSKYPALALIRVIPLATYALSSVVVTDDRVFVGLSTVFAASDLHVYLSAMNDGEVVIELSKPALTPVRTYGEPAETNSTVLSIVRTGPVSRQPVLPTWVSMLDRRPSLRPIRMLRSWRIRSRCKHACTESVHRTQLDQYRCAAHGISDCRK